MMNKIVSAATIVTLLAVSGVTQAASHKSDEPSFNLGGELSVINKTRHTGVFRGNRLGANIFAGVNFNRNIGAEAGYGQIARYKNRDYHYESGPIRNWYIDALGFIPVAPRTDVVVTGGFGQARFKNKQNANSWTSKSNGMRVGAGVQYSFNKCWSVRTMVRHQHRQGFFKNNLSLTLGGIYSIS